MIKDFWIMFLWHVFIICFSSKRVRNIQLRVSRKSEPAVLVLSRHRHSTCHKTQKHKFERRQKNVYAVFRKTKQLIEINNIKTICNRLLIATRFTPVTVRKYAFINW